MSFSSSKRTRKKRKSKLLKFLKYSFLFFLTISLFALGALLIWASTLEIPSVDTLDTRQIVQSTKIYARDGKTLLFDVHKDIRRTYVPLGDISRHIKNATIAIEDTEFYNHKGIRPKAILRAAIVNFLSGSYKQGGSTITQQLVKNTLLTRKKTITRKIKEWILAIKLERKYSKDKILEMYLNEAPYGGNILGVEEAARRFFGKSAKDVTLAEAAYIAALPKAPSYYSPYGPHRDELEARKNTVLYEMYKNGFISKEEYQTALNEKVKFQNFDDKNIKAPHFVFYVIDKLIEKYGAEAVYTGGLRVITTLDWDLQQKAEEIIKKYAYQNEEKFNASNAGAVILDAKNGQILAMVGSRDYFDDKIDGKYNVVLAKRQPGSTFKPIVYSLAFEKGLTPSTVVFDVPTQFSTNCAPDEITKKDNCYAPENYDFKFVGPITLRDALAQSRNIPAVKTLYLVGVEDALKKAREMGLNTLSKDAKHYGLTLVLGGGEVRLLDLAAAYTSFANDGLKSDANPILEVQDASGNILYEFKRKQKRVLTEQATRQVNSVLSDVVAREPAYGRRSFYFEGQDSAVKTGTTNDYRDVWIMGYTPKFVLGTWAGNNDNSPIVKKVAGYVLAPLWRELMEAALEKYSGGKFIPPEKVKTNKPILEGVWLFPDMKPPVHSILYWIDKENIAGPPPKDPYKDPLYPYFEYGVQKWFAQNASSILPQGAIVQPTPAINNNNNTQNQKVKYVKITYPYNGATLNASRPVKITVEAKNIELKKVKFYLNGTYLGAVTSYPFSLIFVPQKRNITQELKIEAEATDFGVYSDKVYFTAK